MKSKEKYIKLSIMVGNYIAQVEKALNQQYIPKKQKEILIERGLEIISYSG